MRSHTSKLGLLLVSPAIILLAIFFLTPALLTGVFSFTNMSSSTGISGGAWVITPNLLRELSDDGISPATIEALRDESYSVDEGSLAAARAAGVAAEFADEIASKLSGQRFASDSEFMSALKTLRTRPRRVRDLKLAMEPFTRSVLNIRFETEAAARLAIEQVVPDIDAGELERIVERSYTGWKWTSENYSKLFSSPETLRIVFNTVFYVAMTLAFNVLVGLFLAITTFYLPRRTGGFFSLIWLLPRITPVVLYAIMWKWFTWDDGFVAALAGQLGLPSFNYMKGSVPSAWTIVILVNGFIGASFGMILFSGALRAIPVQQLWASEVDGATRWQQVRHIILPQLRWPILFVTSYQTLSLLTSYQEIWLTTNGGPGNTTAVWALEAFRTALFNYSGSLQYGLGAAMALVLVAVGMVLSIIYLRLFRFDELVSKPKIEF
ncbi:carbohydrate ABC transporter permease [Oricola thermophila]|uniref:Sugar ABC transporter permease n=1 Tax=Oricola thermophila TaxID=2742145 RepID=A0A6N1V8D7_9HYPH|nr:sugar ABC transporter permease [Oricola thermophila]QKV17174.1 sugar ABC transporter permease [Oricola thermophila]